MIAPFAGEHVGAAATLLADRHARHLAAEPLLADGDAQSWVEQAWTRDGVSGAVSLHDGAVTGYLFGRVAHNDTWGTHAVIDRAGSAAADAETMRDLYAAAAPRWLEAGARLQLANIPAIDELLDPWVRLGFGQMQLHAIRKGGAPERPLPDGVAVRRAEPGDLDAAIMPMSTLIWDHQAGPPAFTGLTPPPEADVRKSWAESFELPDDMLFIAELEGRPAGFVLLYPDDPDVGAGPQHVRLSTQATVPALRGRGVGTALTEHALRWAETAGYAAVATDWRVPNLQSSRFWPARGFRPTFHRLHRMLGVG
jgi:GNAT superfamily N-acetyltransferase